MNISQNYNVMPFFVFLMVFFIDFYIIWPIFYNNLLPRLQLKKLWQKVVLFILINIGVSLAMTYSVYVVGDFIYQEWILK